MFMKMLLANRRILTGQYFLNTSLYRTLIRNAGNTLEISSPSALTSVRSGSNWPGFGRRAKTAHHSAEAHWNSAASMLSPGPNPSATHGMRAPESSNRSRMNARVADDMFP